MKENKATEVILFAFGVLFAVIGYLIVDKLTAIDNTISQIRSGLEDVQRVNARQDRILWQHNDELNLPEGLLK